VVIDRQIEGSERQPLMSLEAMTVSDGLKEATVSCASGTCMREK
jgi:hypothetical protein